jgi:signal recognition particle subunit SRP54
MFESLTDRLGSALRNLSGRGRISESNVREVMGEVRTALLEADVQQDIVDGF